MKALIVFLFLASFFGASPMSPNPELDTTNYYTMLKLAPDFINFINHADSKLSDNTLIDNKMRELISLIEDESQKNRTGRTNKEKDRIYQEMQKLKEALELLKGEDINQVLNVLNMTQQDLKEVEGYTRPKNKIRLEIKNRLVYELSRMISKAFKSLSLTLHQDKNPSISQDLFQEFSNAKEIQDYDYRLIYNKNLSSKGHAGSVNLARTDKKNREKSNAQRRKARKIQIDNRSFDDLLSKERLNEEEYEISIRLFSTLLKKLPKVISSVDVQSKKIKKALTSFLKNRIGYQMVGSKMLVDKEDNRKFIEKLSDVVFKKTNLTLTNWLVSEVKNSDYRSRVLGFYQHYLVNKIDEMMAMPESVNSELAQVAWEILNNTTDGVVMKMAPNCLSSVLRYLEKIAPKQQFSYDNDIEMQLIDEFFEGFFKINQKGSIHTFIQTIDKIDTNIRIAINRLLFFLSKAFENRIDTLSSAEKLSDQEVENVIALILKFSRIHFFQPDLRVKKRSISIFFKEFLKVNFLQNRKNIASQEILLSDVSAASKSYLDIDQINLKNLERFMAILVKKLDSKSESEFAQTLHARFTFDEKGLYERALCELYKVNHDFLHIAWMGRVLENYKKKVVEKADLSVSYKYKQTNKAYTLLEIIESLNTYRTMHQYRDGVIGKQCFDFLSNLTEFIANQEAPRVFDDIKNVLRTSGVVSYNFFENKPEQKPKPLHKPDEEDDLKLTKKLGKLAGNLTQLKQKLNQLSMSLKNLKNVL